MPELGIKEPFPVSVLGEGEPLLLLHGFDSSFLEYRRLAPLLRERFQLFIPDLFGFGFSPRPLEATYGPEAVLTHLDALLQRMPAQPVGVIGASMGGSVAVEMARRQPSAFRRCCCLPPPVSPDARCRFRPFWIDWGPGSWRGLESAKVYAVRPSRIRMRMSALPKNRSLRCICSARAGRMHWLLLPAAVASLAAASPCPSNRCM